jgi:hypothetical protein
MNKRIKFNTLERALTTLLIIALMIQPALSQANDSPTVDSVCSSVFANANNAQEANNQKLDQCKAGKSAQEGYQANDALWKMWASVSVLCGIACGASLGGVLPSFLNHACTALDIGAAITDGVVTKDYTTALTNIAGIGMAAAMGNMGPKGEKNASKSTTKGSKPVRPTQLGKGGMEAAQDVKKGGQTSSVAICLGAALATVTTVTKFIATNTGKETVKSTIDSIAKYKDNNSVIAAANMDMAADTSRMAFTASKQGGGTQGLSQTGSASKQSPCAQGAAGGNGDAVFQCAQTSAASSVPNFISDPQFEKSFQEMTGIALNNFLANATTPSASISAGMSGKLAPTQVGEMDQLVQKITADVTADMGAVASSLPHNENPNDATYSSGGGGAPSGSTAEAEPDMMAMMAGIMEQFGPKQPGAANQNDGVMEVIFANQKKSITDVAEDKKLNIFDRITYRYYFIIKKNKL